MAHSYICNYLNVLYPMRLHWYHCRHASILLSLQNWPWCSLADDCRVHIASRWCFVEVDWEKQKSWLQNWVVKRWWSFLGMTRALFAVQEMVYNTWMAAFVQPNAVLLVWMKVKKLMPWDNTGIKKEEDDLHRPCSHIKRGETIKKSGTHMTCGV